VDAEVMVWRWDYLAGNLRESKSRDFYARVMVQC
jgi:hypothetical protein